MGRDTNGAFRVAIAVRGDGVVVQLFGELDLETISEFEDRLQAVLESKPPHLIFDVTSTAFISAEGYAIIGRSTWSAKRVTVQSLTGLPSKVLEVLGFEDVQCEIVSRPTSSNAVQSRGAEESVAT